MYSNQEEPGAGPSRMGGRIGTRMGGIGDQDGDIPPEDMEGRKASASNKVNLEPEREPSKFPEEQKS